MAVLGGSFPEADMAMGDIICKGGLLPGGRPEGGQRGEGAYLEIVYLDKIHICELRNIE